jgi:outer membrane protein OmpA-like peptidoglycan-associated protein
MEHKSKYYTGIFHSQFTSLRGIDIRQHRFSEIKLEPRFIFKAEREISVEEYQEQRAALSSVSPQGKPPAYILQTQNTLIEMDAPDGNSSPVLSSEFFVRYGEDLVDSAFKKKDFIAQKDGLYHGRITGLACVCIPIVNEEERIKLLTPLVSNTSVSRGIGSLFMPRPPRIPFTGNSGMPLAAAPGCRRRGCSLFSLLFLLLALLSLWKSCFNNNTVSPRIIHDTVYVDENSREDIIKKFLDTTTVFKTQAVELPNVQFYTNSAKLLPYSINSVQQLADYLNEHQQVHAVIEGHTDNVGDPAANLQLSQDRAETVRQLLISFGVEQGRVEARGYGKNRPRADNNTVEGRALNRRVEVRLSNTTRTETKRTEVIDE